MHATSWVRLSAAAWAALVMAPAWAQEKPDGAKPLVRDIGAAASSAQTAGDYWLGIEVAELQPALRSQLKLPADQGVLIGAIAPDSPAAKAGFQQHDVLLAVNDQPLGEAAKLVEAVKNSQGKELAIKLLRAGKEETIKVTPTPRGASSSASAGQTPPSTATPRDALWMWMGQQSDPYRLRILGNGMVLPHGVSATDLPDNLHVTIVREGKSSAKITVKQGDKSWEVTDQELSKLPEDVRKHVEPLLAPQPFRVALPTDVERMAIRGQPFTMPAPSPRMEEMEARMQAQMQDMQRKLEELRKSIDELRAKPKEGA